MLNEDYKWKRFWCPRTSSLNLSDGGYLVDPESELGNLYHPDVVAFEKIANTNCLILLGEPGIGKSKSLENEFSTINSKFNDKQLIHIDLREFSNEVRLIDKIFKNKKFIDWSNGNFDLHIFLDSLDEGLLTIKTIANILAEEFKNIKLKKDTLYLRIACRTADWPLSLEDSLKQIFEKSFGVYELTPLRRIDVESAAKLNNINFKNFFPEIDRMEIVSFAIKPITLEFLLRIYNKNNSLQSNKVELYEKGCRILCEENNPSRREKKLKGNLNPDQKLIIAARIATVTVFSNRYAVWTGTHSNNVHSEDVSISELYGNYEEIKDQKINVGESEISEVINTGLFSSRGQNRMGWAHQTYAEFLAAWYLIKRKISLHQKINLITHPGDQDRKLIPQLHETAAWLASMDKDILHHIINIEPDVLLKSCVSNQNIEIKKLLLEKLFNLYIHQEEAYDYPNLSAYYHKLNYVGIFDQLRPFIIDSTKNIIVRNFAIDVAEACKVKELQNELVDIALNKSEEIGLRVNAVLAITIIGDNENKKKLKPLIFCDKDEDPEDRLRGIVLNSLWPLKFITIEELFDVLTSPRQDNSFGRYRNFSSNNFIKHIPKKDLPIALKWVSSQKSKHELPSVMRKLLGLIMTKSWEHIEKPEILKPFAEAVLSRLKYYNNIFNDHSSCAQNMLLSENPEKRKKLLKTIITLLDNIEDCHFLYHQICFYEDIPWMVDELCLEHDDKKREIWAELIFNSFDSMDSKINDLIINLCNEIPFLYEKFKDYLEPVELDSVKAQKMKKNYEQIYNKNNEKKIILDPSPKERIKVLLEKCEAGDLKIWHDLVLNMTLEVDSTHYSYDWEINLTKFIGWKNADNQTQKRIVTVAYKYLLEEVPETNSWLGKNSPPFSVYYDFIVLTLAYESKLLKNLPQEKWKQWAIFLVGYPLFGDQNDHDYYKKIIKLAYTNAPDEIIKTLDFVLSRANDEIHIRDYIEKFEGCWDNRLETFLLEKVKDNNLSSKCMGSILRKLLEHNVEESKEYAESLIKPQLLSNEENEIKANIAAQNLLIYTSDANWDFLWPFIKDNVEFGKSIFLNGWDDIKSNWPQKLSEFQLTDLCLWLYTQYPPTKDSPQKNQYIDSLRNPKNDLYGLKNSILRRLRDCGTKESCIALQKIADELPELDWLKWTLFEAKKITLRNTWTPVLPQEIIAIVNNQKLRLIQNSDQLLDLLIESLQRLEIKLQGETARLLEIWNNPTIKKEIIYTPKDENHLSNYIKGHILDDLNGKGIIANREVQIRPNMGGAKGEITDILVEMTPKKQNNENEFDYLKVIIEIKGCWNRGLKDDIKDQLVDRYLKDNQCQHGLYLIGWFNCRQWNKNDYRKNDASKITLDEYKNKYNKIAEQLSQNGLNIKSFILNTSLR